MTNKEESPHERQDLYGASSSERLLINSSNSTDNVDNVLDNVLDSGLTIS